jgi:hypothetical protein
MKKRSKAANRKKTALEDTKPEKPNDKDLNAPEVGTANQSESDFAFGILPSRDLKKNLGCG